jgi:hypothetical protein
MFAEALFVVIWWAMSAVRVRARSRSSAVSSHGTLS